MSSGAPTTTFTGLRCGRRPKSFVYMRERRKRGREREKIEKDSSRVTQHSRHYRTTQHTHTPCMNPTIIPDATAREDGDREPKFVLEPILGAPEKAAVGIAERRVEDLVLSESKHGRLI